jgi:soluble lytic murein transglycosylase
MTRLIASALCVALLVLASSLAPAAVAQESWPNPEAVEGATPAIDDAAAEAEAEAAANAPERFGEWGAPAPEADAPAPSATETAAPRKPEIAFPAEPLPPVLRKPADRAHASAALKAARAGHWQTARREAQAVADPLPLAVVNWVMYQQVGSNPGFEALAAFIDKHRDWPAMDTLLRRAEEQMYFSRVSDERVLEWYARRRPRSGEGMVRLGEALIATGREDEGADWVRRGWVAGNFPLRLESQILQRNARFLPPAVHADRLDRLLWEHKTRAAQRLMSKVTNDERLLAEARIALYTRRGDAKDRLGRVPAALQDDGGLAYERARWQRRRGNEDQAEEIHLDPPDDLGRAEKWWLERQILARLALSEGRASEAYQLVANPGAIDGAHYAEAQWLAGWIALRFIKDPGRAEPHFRNLLRGVRYPGSVARANYWLGRVSEALGAHGDARRWYEDGAKHPATFYGQLALIAMGKRDPLEFAPGLVPAAAETARFERLELVRTARLLGELDQGQWLRQFLARLQELADSPVEHHQVAALADDLGKTHLAVAAARRAAQTGVSRISHSYPVIDTLTGKLGAEPALILAVARQESQFNPLAVSAVGARGLMQLMPQTARLMSRRLRENYGRDRLIRDPNYNARLGGRLLGDLMTRWNGNLILVLAAYNAGDGRVNQWIRKWGDPRKSDVDPIDWIELIHLEETRSYVQLVLEGVQIYRQLLNPGMPATLRLDQDMRGRDADRI